MQEGFSYIAASDVPVVVVDVMRGGPGLGNIQPSQSDYNQVTKTAGHGDFHPIVLAPSTIQEAIDLTVLAFDLAEKYRTLVFVVADGSIGQMMEPAELPPMREMSGKRPEWSLTGAKGRPTNLISSIHLGAEKLEAYNRELQSKLRTIELNNETLCFEQNTEDADFIVVAFGTSGRVAQSAVKQLRQTGICAGLVRPITLWPFPEKPLRKLAKRARGFLVVEMNAGQMVHDVREIVGTHIPVQFYGRMGGAIPMADEIVREVLALQKQVSAQKLEGGNGHIS
jgi:2-oxoglutarate ferredoxin oxidoreductase subunit alpha